MVMNIEHLGPFYHSKLANLHLLIMVDGFIRFVFIRAVKSTKVHFVIEYLRDMLATYGVLSTVISDQGTYICNCLPLLCTEPCQNDFDFSGNLACRWADREGKSDYHNCTHEPEY